MVLSAPAAARWVASGSHVCSLYSFPILYMDTTHGGGAGDGSKATNGGKKKPGCRGSAVRRDGGAKENHKRTTAKIDSAMGWGILVINKLGK